MDLGPLNALVDRIGAIDENLVASKQLEAELAAKPVANQEDVALLAPAAEAVVEAAVPAPAPEAAAVLPAVVPPVIDPVAAAVVPVAGNAAAAVTVIDPVAAAVVPVAGNAAAAVTATAPAAAAVVPVAGNAAAAVTATAPAAAAVVPVAGNAAAAVLPAVAPILPVAPAAPIAAPAVTGPSMPGNLFTSGLINTNLGAPPPPNPGQGDKPCVCPAAGCTKAYANIRSYRVHYNIKHFVKIWQCQWCAWNQVQYRQSDVMAHFSKKNAEDAAAGRVRSHPQ